MLSRNVFSPPTRHYRTGEAPPPALLDGLHKSKTLFAGLGIQTQLLYATLDQKLFGPQVFTRNACTHARTHE